MNMNEFEDAILPDDYEAPPEVEEVTEPLDIPAEEETPPQVTEPTEAETLQMLRVKYNKEEREIPIDEAIPLVQKGLNYDKVQERLQQLESDPRLSFVEELAQQFGMDVPTYLEAVKAQKEEQRIQELVEQGISQELAQEMLENRKFRDQFEAEKKAKAEEEKANADYNEFFDYFRQANDRDFNAQSDEIPPSVWEATQKGVPLKYAYMEHQNNQFKQQLQTLKQNESNKQKAPVGSVTAHGTTETASEDLFMQGFNSIK
jgi:hypothetical protein